MRKTLTAAAALAPLCFVVGAGAAQATTTISTGRNTPVATATANNGAPDDVDIASGGSITLTTLPPGLAAVTLNSSNKVTNEGTISATDVNNAIGVLVSGGNTGSFTNTGSITLNESTNPSDSNNDGVIEAPFAKGSGRYGVLVQGGAGFTGDITNGAGGIINVTGNNSYGISVETPLTGNLTNAGSITLKGDNGVALRETQGVSGNVLVTGAISATGTNTGGINLGGNVGGRFSIYSSITSTGYGTTTRSLFNTTQITIQATTSETQQGGSAVVVGANVGGGVYIGAPPTSSTTTNTASTADVNGDGIPDVSEGTGGVSTFGQAPAMVIGAAGRDVALGAVQFTTGNNPYGLVIAGSVAGAGVFDGVQGNGLQIGDASGTGTVHIAGGALISGNVTASAYGADATAIHIYAASTVPEVNVGGTVSAVVNAPLPNATTGVATPFNGSATGLQIDAGSSVNTLTVSGSITATTTGDGNATGAGKTNNAVAVVDNGGSLSTVNLTGNITASTVGSLATLTPTGAKTALDLHNNTTGVTLTLSQAPQTIATAVTASDGTKTTTLVSGPVVQNTTGAAVVTTVTSTDGKTVTTTTTPVAPSIVGDVLLGAGPNTVNMAAGTLTGALALGSNTANVTLDNGASFTGALSYSGTALSLNLVNGAFTTTNPITLTATRLNVGATSTLSFAIDPAHNTFTSFIVNGNAAIAAGAKLGVNLLSSLTGTQTYRLITASSLTVGGADATLAADIPYLFFGQFHSNQAAGTLDLTIRTKSATELGLTPGQGAALPGVYAALSTDAPIQQALFSQFTQAGFAHLYNQLLPDYSGGVFRAASAASRTISRLTAEPNQIENPTGSRGLWAQQFFVGAVQGSGQTPAFQSGGFGFVAGVETGGLGFGAVGATAAFVAVNENDPHSPGDNRTSMSEVEGGLYWQGETGGLTLDARVGAGYNLFSAQRQFVVTDPTTSLVTLSRQTKASWSGYSLSGRIGAAYQIDLGRTYFIRPTVHLDYYHLNQGSYSERFGGPAVDLAYADANGDDASGTASMIFGAKYGRGLVWRPELELGVRDVFSGSPGDVTAHFISGGPNFTVAPVDITGPAGLARLKLKASSEYYEVGVEGGVEARSRYGEGDFKLTVRVLF